MQFKTFKPFQPFKTISEPFNGLNDLNYLNAVDVTIILRLIDRRARGKTVLQVIKFGVQPAARQ